MTKVAQLKHYEAFGMQYKCQKIIMSPSKKNSSDGTWLLECVTFHDLFLAIG